MLIILIPTIDGISHVMILSFYIQLHNNVRAFTSDILKFLQVLKEKTTFSILPTHF